ncbi:MAG: TIR domain-containing protein [Micropepsaceae bacterium]
MTDTTRKLATIVALDVAGYSARTEADEARTTAEVAALRKVIEAIAGKHGGRVFNTAGDGFMLEFGSSLAAVEAAFELAETCEPKVRVGVHLGDVAVQPNGDLLGHGVNVAARLMAKSDPGGALVSADVRRTIRGPLGERLVSRGVMQLDKMAETIEAFALKIVTVTPAPPDVFLSYARDDQAVARKFAEALEREGLAVWWDVALRSGDAYDETMERALKAAKAVVILWSKKSVESRWVRSEATLADRNKTLVPCMIEPCERPIMFELTQTAELAHWQGDAADRTWVAFLGDVKRLVAKEAAPVAAQQAAAPLSAPTVQETLKPGQSGSAPSLAVLPFTNRSHLPDDDVFAEGMVEDVTSALAQGVNVRVLGATATANLRRAAITDLAALGRQLGVRYLLEGNVRRVGTDLRISTQLLEAATGAAIWTAKFDRPLSELAELQEELVTEIAASLDTQVYALEIARALKKPGDITAWEAVARAWSAYRELDAASMKLGIEEAARAVAIAPDYALGHAALAAALGAAYIFGPDDPAKVQRIRDIAKRALALAPDDASVLGWVGEALFCTGSPQEGQSYTARAVRKAPGSGFLHYIHGLACAMINRPEEALSHLKTAERLMPGSHLMWVVKTFQAGALGGLGRWADADAAIDESIGLNPTYVENHVTKALCCVHLGRDAEARRHIERARRLGWDLVQGESTRRRAWPNSPTLEADIAIIRALFAATEPGA